MAMFSQAGAEVTKQPGRKAKGGGELNIEAIIKKAVSEGIEAGRRQAEQVPVDTYRSTERRLRALPDLKDKVKKDKAYLEDLIEELQAYGLGRHSTDIVRFKRSGTMLSDEDIEQAMIQDMRAKIARDEYEINTVETALTPLTSDAYYRTIPAKYFEQLADDDVAAELHCDPSTIRKNRGRLVRRLTVRLYGSDAL